MDDRWGSQSERWHLAMRRGADGSDADRLAGAIAAEIRDGTMPPGALLPTAERLGVDLMVEESVVSSAYAQLERAGLVRSRSDQRVCVSGTPNHDTGTKGRGATILSFGQGSQPDKHSAEND